MSRKLGPTWRSASPCSESRAAAWEASTFASTCGRWLKTATSRSWVAASTATGRAPTSRTKRWRRSYRSPPDCSWGVRYQTAPWKRSARACSTPAVSAPAIGCPPTKRGSAVRLTRSSFVEPTSLTSVSGPDASSAARTSSGRAPTGAHAKQSCAPSTASSTEPATRLDRAAVERALEALAVAAEAHHLRVLDVLAGREADRAADQAHAEDGYAHAIRRSKTACRPAPPRPRACAGRRRSRPRTAPAGRRRPPPPGTGGSRR